MGKVAPPPARPCPPGMARQQDKAEPASRSKPSDDRIYNLLHPLNPSGPLSILH